MATAMKTQRTVRFSRQPSVRSTNLRENMNRQESRRIKSQTPQFPTNYGWWCNPQGAWIKCEIVEQEDQILTLRNENAELKVNVADVLPFNPDVVSDMTSLRYLHEPGILYNLQHRLANQCPYTYMGSILISVNPFEWLPSPEMKEFVAQSMNPENPHPYAIAGRPPHFSSLALRHFFLLLSLSLTHTHHRIMFSTNLCEESSTPVGGH
jgi:myosin heavy subunit